MLDFDTALALMSKYGYTSTSVHPFVYQNGDTIGICYTYNDEEYGTLERIKICETKEDLEEFLMMYNWVQTNGKIHHVRMVLDNYESINPKVMFLRNEKIMVEGEMFDIETYDARENMRASMDDVSKVIYEAGDLLLVYNEIKSRQLQYLKTIITLKNDLRRKYYELQKEVDMYNKIKVERQLSLLPETPDSGISEMMEVAVKDRYNMYVGQRPDMEEALAFLKEVWELCLNLELNTKYYDAIREENEVRNEAKVVDQKILLMKNLNDNLKPLFGTDLVSKFRKINAECDESSSVIEQESIDLQIDAVRRKYSYFAKLDTLYTSDFLREATQNSNYDDLAIKYAPGGSQDVISKYRVPLNEVAANLTVQYKEKLSLEEQSILVLYNNHKYHKLCDAILNIPNFDSVPNKQVMKVVNGLKGISKIKSECYESVKRRIDDPVNANIKNMLFKNFNFTSFETFVVCLIKELSLLKKVNEKMALNGDINMYITVNKAESLLDKKFMTVTNDLLSLMEEVKGSKDMVGITLLKEGTPVLYSPYYFDMGDIYSKGASLEMYIKEMVDFELLVDISDITINIDPNRTNVAKYYTVPNIVGNLSIVDDIKMSTKTIFCKYALTSALSNVVAMNSNNIQVQQASKAPVQLVSNPQVVVQQAQAQVAVPVVSEVVKKVEVSKEVELPKPAPVQGEALVKTSSSVVAAPVAEVKKAQETPVADEKDLPIVTTVNPAKKEENVKSVQPVKESSPKAVQTQVSGSTPVKTEQPKVIKQSDLKPGQTVLKKVIIKKPDGTTEEVVKKVVIAAKPAATTTVPVKTAEVKKENTEPVKKEPVNSEKK